MMRSLFAGVSCLRNHQTRMDVIGNNIANVNTAGFKASRVSFQEGFSSMMESATRPQGSTGGTNPQQVGLGMQIGSIDTVFTAGSMESTGVTTDLAVQGEGFFVVNQGGSNMFTRAGNFTLDSTGTLVSASGARVQGRMAVNGEFLSDTIGDIQLPSGLKAPASATSQMALGGNLDSRAEEGAVVSTSITVFDALGEMHEVKINLTKTAVENQWTMTVDALDGSGPVNVGEPLQFTPDGRLDAATVDPQISLVAQNGQEIDVTLSLGAGTLSGLSQFAGGTTAALQGQNGYSYGTMQSYSIDRTGTIVGAFSNGVNMVLGQVALADFNNPGGLQRMGDSMFTASANSGEPSYGYPGAGSNSEIASGALEMSNVDLTAEFTSMIVTQRGFQANSKVITSTDEMLQELINLKR